MTLRLRRRGSRLFSMNEGRKSQIVLLDERRLDIIIQPKLYASELLDLVASHFKLKEKHFFGLGFIDETNHFNWLQSDKRVLDHDLPKKTGNLLIYFSIKFYVETIGMLRDTQTVELFYLNARQAVFRGPIECESEKVFELAAHVLQACNGDFASEEETREDLKKLPLIPTRALKEHPSISYCEDRVIYHYENLTGMSRGLAIVNYMSLVEQLPTYGIHFYDVKDKKDIPWWLGISLKGIAVYDKNDKNTPRKLFRWSNIENLYCREKKFTIEVHSPKREDGSGGNLVSVSRRTFGGSNVDVHAWFCVSNSLTRCIWSMAVAQHLFDVECRQKRGNLTIVRSLTDLASDLCRSTTSLPGSLGSDLSRSPSSHSLPSLSNSRYDLTIEQSDSLKAEREMYQALKARKEALEEAYRKKTEELKQLCFEEGELTGELPIETPLAPGEQAPTFRRRVGTAFSLSVKDKDADNLSTELSKLELEVELQGKITSAAHRLASDKTVSKYVRKQRRQSYIRSMAKLKDMEKKLGDMRRQAGKPAHNGKGRGKEDSFRISSFQSSSTYCQSKAHTSVENDPDCDKPDDSGKQRVALSPSHSSPQLSSGPGGPATYHHHPATNGTSGYSTGLTSRNTTDLEYPGCGNATTPGSLSLATAFRLDGSHDSGFSSANNMYNLSSQRTSHYESSDQLRSPANSEPGGLLNPATHQPTSSILDYSVQGLYDKVHPPGDTNSLAGISGDGSINTQLYSRQLSDGGSGGGVRSGKGTNLHYGSLDRKQRSYRQDAQVFRDVSPMRYRVYTNQTSNDSCGEPDQIMTPVAAPSNVILEVPVQYETSGQTHSGYQRGGVEREASFSSSASSQNELKHHHYHQQYPHSPTPGLNLQDPGPHYCYSPTMQEGSSSMYQDVDVSHVHKRTHEHGLKAAHHTASQPVFHRIERSVSPSRSFSPSDQPMQQYHQQEQQQQQQPMHSYGNVVNRPPQTYHTHKNYATATTYSDDAAPPPPHSIPIHHVGSPPHPSSSARTPPPTSPISSQPPSSPSSGASSPRTPVPSSHAHSSLVTVSRLQPHMEVSKPYETSDFYRYSEKLRRQRIIDQYQRQLIGADRISRSSTPQSVESDGHSNHSGSTSLHSRSSPSPQSHMGHSTGLPPPSMAPVSHSRGPIQAYGRSASAPLSSMSQRHQASMSTVYNQAALPPSYPNHHHHHNPHHPPQNFTSSPSHHFSPSPSGSFPDGQFSSSSSSYSIKSQGPGNSHFAVQSSYKMQQQVHSSTTKHTLYHPPQPMTCRPVKGPPPASFNNIEDPSNSG